MYVGRIILQPLHHHETSLTGLNKPYRITSVPSFSVVLRRPRRGAGPLDLPGLVGVGRLRYV